MTDTRAFEMTIEIAVSPDAVWQAIVDPAEITRWFASRAEVAPGAGGKWMISWDGNWPWQMEIEIWEPNRRLRLVDRNARPFDAKGEAVNTSVSPLPMAIDWYLEAKGGSTTLRLVHSGFGRGAAWDDEFEGVAVGWPMELNGLKHYLERHRGEPRQVAWLRTVVPVPFPALWSRFNRAEGLVRDGSVVNLHAGDRYSVLLSTGDRIEGTVMLSMPGRGVQVRVDGWNDALFRFWIDRVDDESAVNCWLSTYGMPQAFVEDFKKRMHAEVNRVAGTAAAA